MGFSEGAREPKRGLIHPFLGIPVQAGFCSFVEMRDELALEEIAILHELILSKQEQEKNALKNWEREQERRK